jgi:hypothetical protein
MLTANLKFIKKTSLFFSFFAMFYRPVENTHF